MSTHYLKLNRKSGIADIPRSKRNPHVSYAAPLYFYHIFLYTTHYQFTLCFNFLSSTNAKNNTDITANTAPTNPIYDLSLIHI